MWLRQIDAWKLAHRLLRPMGTEILWMRRPLSYGYWLEMELRREEARTEFIRRGYSTSELVEIEDGDRFRVISDNQRRIRLRSAGLAA
jgi:hypothetical protein